MLDGKIRPEDIDDSYCDGCQHKFKKLEDKEKECAECILTELQKQRCIITKGNNVKDVEKK